MKLKQKIKIALLVTAVGLAGLTLSGMGKEGYQELKKLTTPVVTQIKTSLFHPLLTETAETHTIASLLKVYQAYRADTPIQLRRIGRSGDGGYVVPELAIQAADVVIGYGICDDISFEEATTTLYGKPSWGFDGTCPPLTTKHQDCHFVPLCIASDAFIQNHLADKTGYASFNEQMDLFGFREKQLFIKMDIEGNEYDALPDILNQTATVTGIALEIHFNQEAEQISQAENLMKLLEKDFLLVHVHANNYCLDHFVTKNSTGRLTRVLELSYINKNLVDRYEIAQNQAHPTELDMPNNPNLPDVHFIINEI